MSNREVVKKIVKPFRNKYILAVTVFFCWMIFFDNNNFIDRYFYYKDIRKLKDKKTYYEQKIKEDRQKLDELKTNADNLEKFAREQYLMKKENEDIYLVDEDE